MGGREGEEEEGKVRRGGERREGRGEGKGEGGEGAREEGRAGVETRGHF